MYECTRRHFVELYERYGGPILVFDLIRQVEKRPRETVLGAALAEAITALRQQLRREGHPLHAGLRHAPAHVN